MAVWQDEDHLEVELDDEPIITQINLVAPLQPVKEDTQPKTCLLSTDSTFTSVTMC